MTVFVAVALVACGTLSGADLFRPESPVAGADPSEDEPPPASALLLGVIQQLPPHPVQITGELLIRRRRGVPVATYGVELTAQWGALAPRSAYTIRDAFGQVLEQLEIIHGETPVFKYAAGDPPVPAPMHSLGRAIQESDITWMDLTLSFLWWTDARHETTDSVRGFDCHVILANAPPGQPGPYQQVRLWISKSAGMMMQAEGLDAAGKPLRRLWVRSVRKLDDAWMIKDMEIQKYPAVQRTKFTIAEVERLQP